jgi:hypothetical protein
VDLFGIDADHRGGRRRWPRLAWPLLGGLVGAFLGVLVAPPLLALMQADRLLPVAIAFFAGGTMIAFMLVGRRGEESAAGRENAGPDAAADRHTPGR